MAFKTDDRQVMAAWQEAMENGEDAMKALLQFLLQRLMEEERDAFLGADHFERTSVRKGYRNGYKPRRLLTRVGRMDLMVPKDREGRFHTSIFECYQRSEKALALSLAEMYFQGVSTRKVKHITHELFGLDVSRSTISNLTSDLHEEIEKWRNRRLEGDYPYLVIDARYEKIRIDKEVVSQAVLLAVGISLDGHREVLGSWIGDSENEETWGDVFRELKGRGLTGVKYIVSDAHEGMLNAIRRHFCGVRWQRCQVHFIRAIVKHMSKKDRPYVIGRLKSITACTSKDDATAQMKKVIQEFEGKFPKVADYLEDHGHEILTVYGLPENVRKKMRTSNLD